MKSKMMIAGLVLAGAAALAACSSGSGNDKAAAPPAATKMSTAAAIDVGHTQLGDVLVDANGRTLYGFTNDSMGTSSCNGTCAQNWPPVIATPGWTAAPGTQAANLHTVKRADGQLQLAAGKWPLYTFVGDHAAGDVTGQRVEKFFVVQRDGKLHKDVTTSASSPSTTPSTTPSISSGGYGY